VSKIVIVVILIVVVFLLMRRGSENKKIALENRAIGVSFLVENKSDVEVNSTDTGLQYVVIKSGDGTVKPKAKDKVKVHYHGTLIDGTVFDSSVERGTPISFGLNQVIKGWTEGLQLMVVGDKYRLFIPSELGYGDRSAGKIPAGSVLIFEVELLGIN
jgi:peptidylprolyl isomerase